MDDKIKANIKCGARTAKMHLVINSLCLNFLVGLRSGDLSVSPRALCGGIYIHRVSQVVYSGFILSPICTFPSGCDKVRA